MSERTAILSDIHGNSPALEAVLEDIQRVGCTRVFCLGDVINGVDPVGCLALLRRCETIACLRGNAESYLLTPELDRFPNRDELPYRSVIELIRWWQARIADKDVAWMHSWPDVLFWSGACLTHDSPADRLYPEDRYLPGIEAKYQELCYHAKGIYPEIPDQDLDRLLHWMEAETIGTVFCGHTHVPFCRQVGDKRICNVGSAGMPLDGDPRPSWVLVEEKPDGRHTIAIRRVQYDIERILRLVDEARDYPRPPSADRLETYKARFVTGRFR